MADSPGVAVGQPWETHAGNYREAFAKILRGPTGAAIDLTGMDSTAQFSLDDPDNTNIISWTNTGITVQPTQNFTVSTALGVMLCTDHGLINDDEIVLSNSGGALPTELTASVRYKVRFIDLHSFRVIQIGKTTPIDSFATAGTGTHSFIQIGYIAYQWQSSDLTNESQENADYKARFRIPGGTSGQYDTYPREGWWPVRNHVNA